MNIEDTLNQVQNFQNDIISLVKKYEAEGMLQINIDMQLSLFGIWGLYGDTETEDQFRELLDGIVEKVVGV